MNELKNCRQSLCMIGLSIMLDCGIHPGKEGSNGLPFFDTLDDPAEIDIRAGKIARVRVYDFRGKLLEEKKMQSDLS